MDSIQESPAETSFRPKKGANDDQRSDVISIKELRRLNDGLPVHKLPIELLLSIFQSVLQSWHPASSYYHHRCTLSGVCARWYFVIKNSPQFWTTVSENVKEEGLRKALQRSSGHLLDIECGTPSYGSRRITREHLMEFLGTVVSTIERWRTLSLNCLGVDSEGPIKAFLQAPAPNLERLVLDDREMELEIPDVELFGGNSPKLEDVRVVGAACKWSHITFKGLKRLHLSYIFFDSVKPILDIIRDCPQLHTLELLDCNIADDNLPTVKPVWLPNLQVLDLGLDDTLEPISATEHFLNHVSAPTHCALYVTPFEILDEDAFFKATFGGWLCGRQTPAVLEGIEGLELRLGSSESHERSLYFDLFSGPSTIKGGVRGCATKEATQTLACIWSVLQQSRTLEPTITIKILRGGATFLKQTDFTSQLNRFPPITRLELEALLSHSEYEDIFHGSSLHTGSLFLMVRHITFRGMPPGVVMNIVQSALRGPAAETGSASGTRIDHLDHVEIHVREQDFLNAEKVVEVLRNNKKIGKVSLGHQNYDEDDPAEHRAAEFAERTLQLLKGYEFDRNLLDIEDSILGSGGYADVRKAKLKSTFAEFQTGTVVAVKQLRPRKNTTTIAPFMETLAREIAVWAGLQNRYVVRLIGFTFDKRADIAWMISTFASSGTLRGYISNMRQWQNTRTRLAIDVARGLEYLHNHNPPIRHGDIKGENVLINGNDEAVLTDFGLSSIVQSDQSDRSGSEGVQGTLRYMSPELLLEEDPPLTLESDIWALGCLFLEIMTDQSPYEGVEHEAALTLKIACMEPPAPEMSMLQFVRSDRIRTLMSRSWNMEPEERPSASECLDVLCSDLYGFDPDQLSWEVLELPSMGMKHALHWGSKRRRAAYWIAAVNYGGENRLITVTADLVIKQYNMNSGEEHSLTYTTLTRDSVMEGLGGMGELHTAAISPDGRFALGGILEIHDGDIRIWELVSGTMVGRLHGHSQRTESLAFIADGSLLASGGYDHTARCWDLKSLYTETSQQLSEEALETEENKQHSLEPKVTFKEHRGSVDALAISEDGNWVVSVSLDHDDHDVRLWNPHVGKTELMLSGHVGGGKEAGGIVASGDWDGRVQIWKLETQV
ncbi:hypothetical protein FRC05_001005 [Tulasnella sp. 425]|nr:hypothetical protein FRC05_001005 [Tulasnella sp. 425]